jgi:MtfA peptidase
MRKKARPAGGIHRNALQRWAIAASGLAAVVLLVWIVWIVVSASREGGLGFRTAWALVFAVLALGVPLAAGLVSRIYERLPGIGGPQPRRRRVHATSDAGRSGAEDATDSAEPSISGKFVAAFIVAVFIVLGLVLLASVFLLIEEVRQGRGFTPSDSPLGYGMPIERLAMVALAVAVVLAGVLGSWMYERWQERTAHQPRGRRGRFEARPTPLPPASRATATPAADPLPAASRRFLRERCDHYLRLPGGELRAEFDRQVHAFVSMKRITGVEVQVTSEMRLLVAASAVTLTVGWPGFEWKRLSEVLLYPQDFDADYRFESGQTAGQAHQWGIVLLSVPSLRRGFEDPHDGHHVGVHEFMHLLDVEGGEFDGIPAGFTMAHTADWDRIRKREERRLWRGHSVLDGYGLTNRVEFLAVTAEAFVETPVALRDRHRQLYAMLAAYFCQDPAAWEEARR